jgi:Choline dehydrogenase and related flavoproteins
VPSNTRSPTRNGERCSAAKAYLTPNLSRKNLEILIHAVSAKVVIENRRACAVSYYQGDELKEVRARREVILAGGAFGSPQVLQLSGIGAGEELKQLGIPVVNELPGVGKNLQDHIDYVQSWRVPSNTETVGASLRGAAKITSAMFEWRNKRSGLITTTYATAGAFFRSSPDVLVPDLQLVFVIALVDDHARKLHMGHGISCHVEVLRPYSRGTVRLEQQRSARYAYNRSAILVRRARHEAITQGSASSAAHHGIQTVRFDARQDAVPDADRRSRRYGKGYS